MSLRPFRVELDEANDFVRRLHRHHNPVTSHRFSLGVGDAALRGVAIVGRPVGRGIDFRAVVEVLRVCTDGARNACSWLYTAAARCAREMGFHAVITYTLTTEEGASLRACGWWPETLALRSDYSFSGGGRARSEKPAARKVRWLWLTGNDVEPSAITEHAESQLTLEVA